MKLLLINALFILSLFVNRCYAFDEINGNKIVLITSKEHENFPEQVESITRQRAENSCILLNKVLVDYSFKEVKQDYIFHDCNSKNCITIKDIEKYKIPNKEFLQPVSYQDMELHYHDGGATIAVITLGLIPLIITYPARIATNITCIDKKDLEFTTNWFFEI